MKHNHFEQWKEKEALAESMIPIIGKLYRERNIIISIYGRPLINRSVVEIIKAHKFVKRLLGSALSMTETRPILDVLVNLKLAPARLDIGKMAANYRDNQQTCALDDYIAQEVKRIILIKEEPIKQGQDIVLYGFGRIGRLMARLLIERAGSGQGLNLRAIVIRPGQAHDDLKKRASLLRRDSIHGPFRGTIDIDEAKNYIYANGVTIQVIYANEPDKINYQQYGINNAIVVDNTGKWRNTEDLGLHLKSPGVARVLLTAPGKDNIKNIVYGVNHHLINDDLLVSAASCTTNAITPVLQVIDEFAHIKNGHIETVHSYTNDQNLIDNYHKGSRRGRSAALNMVITETGAASAVAKALPQLKGKLTGSAIRVPTPNVSLAVLHLNLNKSTTAALLNDYLRTVALHSDLRKQIDFTCSTEVVSSDFIGNRHTGIVDSTATIVQGTHCVLYIWYDNEFGYSCQVNRILQNMANVMYPYIPD